MELGVNMNSLCFSSKGFKVWQLFEKKGEGSLTMLCICIFFYMFSYTEEDTITQL